MKIQILGTGCPKCKRLTEVACEVAAELGIEYELEKVTDIERIMSLGVMITPALLVDGKISVSGKIPSHEEMKKLLLSS
jgi:small redox-active disulfide protein 2